MKIIALIACVVLAFSCSKDNASKPEVPKGLAFFIARNDSVSHLWYMRPDGLSFTKVLEKNIGTASDNPAWSSDGRRIYFTSRTGKPGENGVFSIKSDGSDFRTILKDNESQIRKFYQLALDKKDRYIIFSLDLLRSGRKVIELYSMSVSGGGISRITSFEAGQAGLLNTEAYAGSFFPNDSLISFSQGDPSATGKKDVKIYTANIYTGEIKLLRTFKADNVQACTPTCSPDGKRLVLSIDGFIHTMNSDGTELKALGSVKGYHPAWDSNGKDIYFSSYGVPGMRRGIYKCDVNFTNIKIISRSSGFGAYGGLALNK